MLKFIFSILLSLIFFNASLAKDVSIQENIKLTFVCDLDKKIIKNSEYNYQTFLAKDLDEKSLGKFEIEAIKPEKLLISGLSLFLSKSEKLNIKIVNKDVVLFKAVDKEKNYSESAIIDRKSGELINYPVVEMEFTSDSNQVEYILSPAKINNDLKSDAEELAIQVAEKLQITGILAVEMFLTSENEILVNEVAPRPHNSYHFSIEGSYTSQFEQLLRSILDMPLGSKKIIEAAVMVNLVGEKGSNGPVIYKNFDQIIGLEGVNPHIYGKFETRFNRKMGHVTVINENIDKAKELAKEIKETIIITSEK